MEPIIAYHGSDAVIDKFTLDYLGDGKDVNGPGVYFTSSYEDAEKYGKHVYKVELRLNKVPSMCNLMTKKQIEAIIKKSPIEDVLTNWSENNYIAIKLATEAIYDFQDSEFDAINCLWYDFFIKHEKMYLALLANKYKYDGAIIPMEHGVTHYVVYNPACISII